MHVRLIEHNGTSASAQDWSRKTGISAPTLIYRHDVLGWDWARALTTPLQPRGARRRLTSVKRDRLMFTYTEKGAEGLRALAKEWEVSPSTLYRELGTMGIETTTAESDARGKAP